jgi:WD40 repeat protein
MQRQATLEGKEVVVHKDLSFSPDGRLIAGREGTTGERVVWSVTDGRVRHRTRFGRREAGQRAAFDWESWGTDSHKVMLVARNELGVWDLERNSVTPVMAHDAPVLHAAMSPNEELVASLDSRTTVQLWDAGTGRRLRVLGRRGVSPQRLYPLSFSPDSRRLAVAGGLNGLRLYDLLTGQELGTPNLDFLPRGCLFSEDGEWLALAGAPGFVYLRSRPGSTQPGGKTP